MNSLFHRMLQIPPEEALVSRRGFHVKDQAVEARLDTVGRTFLHGYHLALRDEGDEALARDLRASVEPELQGFAFEGAGMSLVLMDRLSPRKRGRFESFWRSEGSPHHFILHIGAGWALARLPWLRWRAEAFLGGLDPLLRGLVADGYGFHQGYFHWQRFIKAQRRPRSLSAQSLHAFDQGVGRSLWFVEGASMSRVPAAIASFPEARRADLWSGVGLACAYAGGRSESAMQLLRASAGPYSAQLAQGAVFAAAGRQRGGNPAVHTDLACRVLCGCSAAEAADIMDACLAGLPMDAAEPAHEILRRRIQDSMRRNSGAAATPACVIRRVR